jgi:hypothetical protein
MRCGRGELILGCSLNFDLFDLCDFPDVNSIMANQNNHTNQS